MKPNTKVQLSLSLVVAAIEGLASVAHAGTIDIDKQRTETQLVSHLSGYFANVGPRQHMGKVMPDFIRAIRVDGEPLKIDPELLLVRNDDSTNVDGAYMCYANCYGNCHGACHGNYGSRGWR